MLVQAYKLMAHDFLLFLLFSCIISTNIHACKQTERSSLLSYASTLSSHPLNWTSLDCCCWKGITCDQDGWVTRLLLSSKGLKGGISPFSLVNLTHLTHLNLSHNSLYGSLETQFFLSLNQLEILDLSYNHIFGELPLSLPSINIRIVDLSSNHFFGAIPSSFFQRASNLTSFNVSNNTFTGYVPSSICLQHYSPFLRRLDFSSNVFSGNLAPGLGKCSKLQVFRAGHNNISGLFPEDIYNATKVEEIALPFNSLHGAISDKIVNFTNLAILDLSFNQFGGELPLNLGKLSKLKFVTLDYNNLEGVLPPSLMNCTNLVELHLGINHLEGDISVLDFSRLSQLTKLDLMINNFTGTVPVSLYSCRFLKAIRLTGNHLEGQIQAEILSLKSLSFLSLGFNQFTNLTGAMKILMSCRSLHALFLTGSFVGERMPSDDDMVDFHGFQNLRILALVNSNLTGQIPLWLSKLKNLEVLALRSNQITGPIPSWLGTLPRLFYIGLSENRISGEFPKQLCRLPSLLYEPNISSQVDNYELEFPAFSFTLSKTGNQTFTSQTLNSYPATIDLSKNNISGYIPAEIGQLKLLRKLALDSNNFSGIIPDQISNVTNLEVLNLSTNHLCGIIPSSLASLNFLKEFNVSYNNLEGPIPIGSQLQTFDASAFEGNPKLCGAPLPNKCEPSKGIDANHKNNKDVDNGLHQLPWFYIFTALGFIVGFWGVCGSLVISKTWRYVYFRFIDNLQDRLYVMIS
ncbi:PREDICTED: tyrosine-sulfated glycopeptide receptor 1-like [Prunus mume]|uniref:Tyrosine-sulfated glycopeptide receptor 1-like n=1 Tax=Prunus mume TaxID=102107 RepID=A0ABM0NZI5_PRUMU|nr:PREDICTED: tyrosine-sulfated glycopeptide receptor 1-like [Prunus mume]